MGKDADAYVLKILFFSNEDSSNPQLHGKQLT